MAIRMIVFEHDISLICVKICVEVIFHFGKTRDDGSVDVDAVRCEPTSKATWAGL